MSGGHHIRAVGSGSGADASGETGAAADEPLTLDASWVEDAPSDDNWEEEAPARRTGWIAPVAAILAALGWSAFFLYAHWSEITAGVTPAAGSALVVSWAVPVLLIVSLVLLALRLSTREAARFADAAAALRGESVALETRLSVVNRELSLAREFLAAQSRELESLGRIATQRISEHADRLQELVRDNGAQVDAIAGVSRAALENMDKLRDDLPVVANAARDVSNQIGAAGNTAHDQLEGLVAGFNRLNEFGQASERQVASLRGKVDDAIGGFEAQVHQLDEIVGARFAALRERSDALRAELDGREVEALTAMRHRADRLREEIAGVSQALESSEEELLRSLQARVSAVREGADTVSESLAGTEREAMAAWNARVETLKTDLEAAIRHVESIDNAAKTGAQQRLAIISQEATLVDAKLTESHSLFVTEIEKRRAEAAALAKEHAGVVAALLAELDTGLAERRDDHAVRTQAFVEQGEAIAARLAELSREMAAAAEHGREAESALAAAIDTLGDKLGASRKALGDTDRKVADLTDASVRLLELIRASAEHSRTDLPTALSETEERLVALGERGEALGLMLTSAGDKSREVSDYVIAAQRDSTSAMEALKSLQGEVDANHEAGARRIAELRGQLAALARDSEAASADAQGALRDAIAELEAAARSAVTLIEEEASSKVSALAARIADDTNAALDAALRERVGTAIAELEDTASHAAGTGRDAVQQLRDQLAKVNELTANLESRVALARQRAEEQVDGDFSRRVALITESLNSNAIDIARALSADVTDTAWTSYLRGDRGIFTRRAVRLLEPAEARDVAELYDNDGNFREHVNRYIHDFEGMLRTMLSTRDGHAIGVTLLSSDMGKLYVALAQAIERLRD
ncbi:ATPase [Tsuneonella sp. YG55]|uniref:ATPase n=1 Tax=Tsuneonella litorea TaxID=2976475 RepID=A0A9X2W2K2_9SPHN|nr:ATPase [Tsuneonella litorea]MCT2558701.1 ATPase [Tsuneonella litorea]